VTLDVVEISNAQSQSVVEVTESLQTQVTEHSSATVSALSQSAVVPSRVQVPVATRLDLPGWQEDRLLPQE